MKKIIILDFEGAEVIIKDYDQGFDLIEPENFLISLNLNPNNCQWMIVDELKLKIE